MANDAKIYVISHTDNKGKNIAQQTVILTGKVKSMDKALELFKAAHEQRVPTFICEKGAEEGGVKLAS